MVIAEYVIVYSKYSPLDIGKQYQVDGLISEDGYVYTKITKGMYDLKQASIITYKTFISHMEPHDYHPFLFMIGLWAHRTRKICFVHVWKMLVYNGLVKITQVIFSTLSVSTTKYRPTGRFVIILDWKYTGITKKVMLIY